MQLLQLSGNEMDIVATFMGRHGRGSEKMDLGSDPMDLDPGSFEIIDPTLSFCREIHWDHRSGPDFCREIQWDPRSHLDFCREIH